jgi:hypothetical protein
MSNSDNSLRAFGMSSMQIISEIRGHERLYGLSLLPREYNQVRKISGYEQFELDVQKTASLMSEYYEIFFCLETSIRRLVTSILLDAEGKDWWLSTT